MGSKIYITQCFSLIELIVMAINHHLWAQVLLILIVADNQFNLARTQWSGLLARLHQSS